MISDNDAECDRWRDDVRAFAKRVTTDADSYWTIRNTGELPPADREALAELHAAQPDDCPSPKLVPGGSG